MTVDVVLNLPRRSQLVVEYDACVCMDTMPRQACVEQHALQVVKVSSEKVQTTIISRIPHVQQASRISYVRAKRWHVLVFCQRWEKAELSSTLH